MTEVRLFERMGSTRGQNRGGTGVVIAGFFIMPRSVLTQLGLANRMGARRPRTDLYVAASSRRSPTPTDARETGFGARWSHTIAASSTRRRNGSDVVALVPPAHRAGHRSSSWWGRTIEASKRGRPLWPALILIALMAGMGIVITSMQESGLARESCASRIDALESIAR